MSTVLVAGLTVGFASSASASPLPDGSDASSPTIWSGQADYGVGATVTLWGAGWQPGEAVHVHVNDDQGQTWSYDADGTADESGDLTVSFTLPDSFIAVYRVTATGGTSGTATTTFTDGNAGLHLTSPETAPSMDVPYTKFSDSNCSVGGILASAPVNNPGSFNVGPSDANSIRVGAPIAAGFIFTGWTFGTNSKDNGTPAGNNPCITVNPGSGADIYAHFTSANHAPAIASNAGTVNANEGSTASNTGTWSDADSGDTVTLTASAGTVTRGSGTWSWSFATSDGPAQSQLVTITATDNHGASSFTTFQLNVANVAPTGTLTNNGPITEGGSATVSFTGPADASSVDAASLHYAFSCTGADLSGVAYASASTTNSASCSFPDNGSYTVTGVIVDKDGGQKTDSTVVQVTDATPSVTAPSDQTANEGSATTFTLGSFTDPGPDSPWAVDVNWGDGSSHTLFNATSTGSLGTRSHAYDDNGSYTVTVKVTDKDGASGTNTFAVTVTNVAPTATFSNDGPIDEGSSFHLSLGSPGDPSSADTTTGFTYAFDCGDATGYSTFSSSATATCPTSDDGTRSVKAKIRDKDGGTTEYTDTVKVTNVPPTVTAPDDQASDEGSSASLDLGSFTDPGADNPWAIDVNWGDGSSDTTFNVATTGSLGSAHHTYADGPTSPTVTVTVTDKDGGADSQTFQVTVDNVPPTVTLDPGNDTNVDEGSTHTYKFTATDPGLLDTLSRDAGYPDCDAAASSNGSLVSGSYSFDQATHKGSFQCFFPNGPATANVKIKLHDSDGGTSSASESVQVVQVANVPPTVTAPDDQASDEGSSASLDLGSFTDPGPDTPWAVTVDWGDGSATTNFTAVSTGSLGSRSHTYDDNGTYTATVTVTDSDGAGDSATFAVDVANVVPTASFGNDGPVAEGTSFKLSLTDPSDPSSADTTAGFTYAFDCGYGYGAFSAADTATCPTTDNDTRSVAAEIRDKDGGTTAYTDSVTITNVAPTASFSNTAPVDEGSSFQLSLSSAFDPSPADTAAGFSYAFDCGDGSGYGDFSSSATATCPTNDDGTRHVAASIRDKDGGTTAYTDTVAVHNVAPTGNLSNNGPVDEGSAATIAFTSPSDVSSVDAASLHFGFSCSGADLSGTTYTAASATNTASCAFPDNGMYTVTGVVVDKDGGATADSTTVQVNNVPPTVTAAADQSGDEGTSTAFDLGSFTDPGADSPWMVAVNWGDGSGDTTFTTSAKGALGTRSHTYADGPASETVTVTVTDKDGASDSRTFALTVNNLPPTGSLGNNGPVDEGSAAAIAFTNPSDPSSIDAAGLHYAFSCSNGDLSDVTYAAASATNSASCAFADQGTYTVSGVIIDKDGGRRADTTSVHVNNVAPAVTAPATQTSNEGSSASFSLGSFSDPGPDSPWAVDVNWGDGSAHATFNAASTGSLGSRSHSYDDNGSYTLTVTVTDKDGASGSKAFAVTVANVAPSATFGNDGPVSEGTSFHLSLTGPSDPSGADTTAGFTYAFDCGSGYGSFGSAAGATCPTTDNGTRSVAAKLRDKDGGVTQYTATVNVTNVAPTITSFTGTGSFIGPLTTMPSTFTTVFSDPGTADTWSSLFTWNDGTAAQTVNPFTTGQTQTHIFATAGCGKTVTVKVSDDDGGFDTKSTTVSVGTASFMAPMTNQPVTNKLKNGQVLPVKVQITDCNGLPVTGLSPAIRLVAGDQTTATDDTVTPITPDSVSSADTTGVMRYTDGAYMYNLSVNLPKLNTDYTVVIYPYGVGVTTQALRHVIQATK